MSITYPSNKTWEVLQKGMFHIRLNANDFFGYACADCVDLCSCDFNWAFPIIDEFGYDGLNAVLVYIEDCNPIIEFVTPDYIKALDKITELKPLIYSKIEEWPPEFLNKVSKEKITSATREEQKGRKRHG